VFTYKLLLRNDLGFAMQGMEMADGDERVSANFTIEVYDAEGEKVNATVADAAFGDARNVGYNCVVSVPVGDGAGCAKAGERLTLAVTDIAFEAERFRSSAVLPPVGGMFGFAGAPVGVFRASADDTDYGWDLWRMAVEYVLSEETPGFSLGGPDEDFDGDGLPNGREYELGTDPAGGALEVLMDKPSFSIEEAGEGSYKVVFAFDPGHVYSIRAIEGTEAIGRDGRDLELFEDAASLDAGEAWGTYVVDFDEDGGGTKAFWVKKPAFETYLVGLAVDGRLQEYIQVGAPASVVVTPGEPLEYDSEAAALAAQAAAEIAPSEAVAAALAGDAGAAEAYAAQFTAEVRQEGDAWILSAELTPEARTNLAASASAATGQFPIDEIAALPAGVATNVALAGCAVGFYYSLYDAAAVADIAADEDTANLNVLCGADGSVAFPNVKKPSETIGFFAVGAETFPSVQPGDRPGGRTP
jgi:hypothetical protein